jgi:hypothetical protein
VLAYAGRLVDRAAGPPEWWRCLSLTTCVSDGGWGLVRWWIPRCWLAVLSYLTDMGERHGRHEMHGGWRWTWRGAFIWCENGSWLFGSGVAYQRTLSPLSHWMIPAIYARIIWLCYDDGEPFHILLYRVPRSTVMTLHQVRLHFVLHPSTRVLRHRHHGGTIEGFVRPTAFSPISYYVTWVPSCTVRLSRPDEAHVEFFCAEKDSRGWH